MTDYLKTFKKTEFPNNKPSSKFNKTLIPLKITTITEWTQNFNYWIYTFNQRKKT